MATTAAAVAAATAATATTTATTATTATTITTTTNNCTKAVGKTPNQSGLTNQITIPFGCAMTCPAEHFLLPCVHHLLPHTLCESTTTNTTNTTTTAAAATTTTTAPTTATTTTTTTLHALHDEDEKEINCLSIHHAVKIDVMPNIKAVFSSS